MPAASKQARPNSIGFGMVAFKKFPELIPLAVILSIPAGLCVAYCGYSLYQKTDVVVLKNTELPPWERVNPTQAQKLLTFNQQYKRIPELDKLRDEIGSYKTKE